MTRDAGEQRNPCSQATDAGRFDRLTEAIRLWPAGNSPDLGLAG